MKEIDINIEGYNVNGICVGCLNYNRKMYYQEDVKDCYKILADIDFQSLYDILSDCQEQKCLDPPLFSILFWIFDMDHKYLKTVAIKAVPIGISIKVCYECIALVQKVFQFRFQILSSFKVLNDYSHKHPILNSPKDLTAHAVQRLSLHSVKEHEIVPKDEIAVDIVKTEDIFEEFSQFDEPELKSEIEDIYIQEDNYGNERVTSDDDVTLSALKKEKKKKKKKTKEKKKPEKVPRKLKNLPPFVELYTMSETEMWSVREKDISSEEFSKLKYKCDGCIIAFNTKRLMEMHQSGKHTAKSETAQQCDVCTAYFLTGENLSAHRRLHMNAYRCRECGLVSCVKRVMSAHECARRLERYSCTDCDMTFSARSRLAYHRAASHGERPQCDCCGKIFANKMTLKYHLKVLPQAKSGTTKESVPIPCKGCDKVFQSKKSYRAHVVIHENRSYPCPTCGKLFQWKRNLARHARNHRERAAGTTHACRACGKTFASRDCYNNHMRLSKRHVPESQYTHACNYCSKKFATKWCLVDHVDWEHLKRIKYQCNVCFKAFKTAKIMYAHISNLHAGKRVTLGEHLCHVCGKSYKTVKRLKSHVWAMHTNRTQEKSFKCPSCPAAFSWHTSVYKHLKLMHPKRNKPARVAAGRELFPEQPLPQ